MPSSASAEKVPALPAPVFPLFLLRDPVFLTASFLLALNCLFLRPRYSADFPFLSSYWNDLLLIPVALPPVLWLQSILKWRPWQNTPGPGEILFHLILWCFCLEVLFPFLFHRGTSDSFDVLAYSAGGLAAALSWRMFSRNSRVS